MKTQLYTSRNPGSSHTSPPLMRLFSTVRRGAVLGVATLILSSGADAQALQWAWMKGSTSVNQAGTYGTLGAAAASNTPGARSGSMSWVDDVGDLWLYGGIGYGSTLSSGNLSDLWRFSTATAQWTWVKGVGTTNEARVLGTQNVAVAGNTPGARNGGLTWVDAGGNLWLFGGNSPSGRLNDLWKYDKSTGFWTWIKGGSTVNQNGVYGTMTVPNSNNTPGARQYAVSWKDPSGNFWLFGGAAFGSSGGLNQSNDLWKFSPTTLNWTWMGGSSSGLQNGSYGTSNTPSANNYPGAREYAVSWADASGNLWLFGGNGRGATSTVNGFLNDLWRYNTTTSEWTWMTGSKEPGGTAQQNGLGNTASTNTPGCRQFGTGWTDAGGNLWLFGGGASSSGSGYNDLWRFSTSSGWSWMKGTLSTSQPSTYGTQGVAAAANTPGGRERIAATWRDNSGDLWLFGGVGNVTVSSSGNLNDLWKFQVAASCNVSDLPTVSAGSNTICANQSTTLSITAGSLNGSTSWKWYAGSCGGTSIGTGTSISVSPSATTTYYVRGEGGCTANGACGSVTVTVNSLPTGGTTVTNVSCNGGANGAINLAPSGGSSTYTFDWGNNITTEDRTGLTTGAYSVTITDGNGCSGIVSAVITQPSAIQGQTTVTNVTCNGGASGAINLTPSGGTPGYTFDWGGGISTEDRTGLSAGTYAVTITDVNGCQHTFSNIAVSQPTAVSGSVNTVPVSCYGGSNGAIDLNPSGGQSPYTYNWGTGITSEDRSGLIAGSYSVTVTDANGCAGTVNATVTQPSLPVNGTMTTTGVSCFGGSNGAINLTPSGGTPGYAFDWGGGISTEDRTGLAAGSYTVTITDANGCAETFGTSVSQPSTPVSGAVVVTDATCPGSTNGAINLTPSGGTPGYTFDWGGNITTEDRTGVIAGTYTATITDANGCTATVQPTVGATSPAPTAAINVVPGNTTYTGQDPDSVIYLGYGPQSATLQASASGGSGFTYTWSGMNGSPMSPLSSIGSASPTFLASTPGMYQYQLTVTNSLGCPATVPVAMCVRDVRVPQPATIRTAPKIYMCIGGQTQQVLQTQVAANLAASSSNRLGDCSVPPCLQPMLLPSRMAASGTMDEDGGVSQAVAAQALAAIVFPNPSTSAFTLRIESAASEAVDVRVLDLTGREVERLPVAETGSEVTLGSRLSPGVYFVEVRSGDARETIRIVKL